MIPSFKPLALPAITQQRLLAWTGLALGALAVLLWASVGLAQGPASTAGQPWTRAGWTSYHAGALHFYHPVDWTVTPLSDDGRAYRVAPADRPEGTGIVITLKPAQTLALDNLERAGVARVERDETITRHFLRILPRTRVADHPAAHVRYTADLASGRRIEGLWVARPAPDEHLLTFSLTVHSEDYFRAVYTTYKRLLASVTLEESGLNNEYRVSNVEG